MKRLPKGELLKLKTTIAETIRQKWKKLEYDISAGGWYWTGSFCSPDGTLIIDVTMVRVSRGRRKSKVQEVRLTWGKGCNGGPHLRLTPGDIVPLAKGFQNNNYR